MEIPFIGTDLPRGSIAFVFGSVLWSSRPRDFDLLIVYNPSICPSDRAYTEHRRFSTGIEQKMGLRVDMTLLTYDEEKHSSFIQRTGAVPVENTEQSGIREFVCG